MIKDNLYDFLTLIPKGKVVSYNFLSKLFSTHPRWVARINASNQNLDTYPCYKVVGYDGGLSWYVLWIEEKIRRLQKDWIVINGEKIDKKYFWNPKLFNYFVAFPLSKDFLNDFKRLLDELKDSLGTKNFIFQKSSTPHVTLRFLWDLSIEDYNKIVTDSRDKLWPTLQKYSDVNLYLNKFWNFWHRVYFLETNISQRKIFESFYQNYAQMIPYHTELRPYHPHLTLFKAKDSVLTVNESVINRILDKYKFEMKLDKIRFFAAVDNIFQVPLVDISL